MTFFEKLIEYDKELFVYLNSLGNEHWDAFWMGVTNMLAWIPLYVFLLYLIYRAFGWKKTLFYLFFIALMVAFSDQFANLIKYTFERLRPNNDPEINTYIRILKTPRGFSFYSAHAGTSMVVSTFMYNTLKSYYKYMYLLFIWPVLFAYSRIYVGVHFPTDILTGALAGALIGYLFYRLSLYLLPKFNL